MFKKSFYHLVNEDRYFIVFRPYYFSQKKEKEKKGIQCKKKFLLHIGFCFPEVLAKTWPLCVAFFLLEGSVPSKNEQRGLEMNSSS